MVWYNQYMLFIAFINCSIAHNLKIEFVVFDIFIYYEKGSVCIQCRRRESRITECTVIYYFLQMDYMDLWYCSQVLWRDSFINLEYFLYAVVNRYIVIAGAEDLSDGV